MQNRIEHQKAVADKVLAKLELLDPHCIVAGGAARDWYLNKPATDIDVFLYAPQFKTNNLRVYALTTLGFTITDKYENWTVNDIYKGNKLVQHLYNTVVDEEKVQLIFMRESTFTSVVDTFPISISKVWYKHKNIRTTKEFKNSIEHKIIWKTIDSYSEDNKYLLKIRDKFSDYAYVTVTEAKKIIEEADKDILIKKLRDENFRLINERDELESKNRALRIKLRYENNFPR